MADEKTVRKELLASAMYLNGTDVYRGDEIDLTPEQAERLQDEGLVADVGHLAKIEEERQAAEAEAADRAAEEQRLADEEAHRKMAHAEDRLASDEDEGDEDDDEDGKPVRSATSGDGPRTTRRAGAKWSKD